MNFLSVSRRGIALRKSGYSAKISSLSVGCVRVELFAGRFLDQFEQEFIYNFMKRALKKGVLATVAAPNSFIFVPHPACLGRCTLLKWRLRRHLPPRPNWWRRSCPRTPVAPPAPAGSILVDHSKIVWKDRKSIRELLSMQLRCPGAPRSVFKKTSTKYNQMYTKMYMVLRQDYILF